MIPLHAALLRNLGVVFNEIDWLHDLAEDLRERWSVYVHVRRRTPQSCRRGRFASQPNGD